MGFVLEDGTPLNVETSSTSGPRFVLEDGTPINVDTSPSWGEATYQVAKDLGEGAFMAPAALLGLANDAGSSLMRGVNSLWSDSKEPVFQLANTRRFAGDAKSAFDFLAGVPEGSPDVVEGPAQDYSKAVLQSVAYPGGPILNAASGLGAEAAHRAFPNSSAAPIAGGIAAAVPVALLSGIGGAARQGVRGATQAEIKGSAARALKDYTGLSAREIEEAIAKRPADDLGALMTTAEVTDNAGMAQLEKVLSSSDQAANMYKARAAAREAAREGIISDASTTASVNKEGLGTKLIDIAGETQKSLDKAAKTLWDAVPRNKIINVEDGQKAVKQLLSQKQAGLLPDRRVQILAEQFTAIDPKSPAFSKTRTSGALQDIRSDALALMRDKNLTPNDERILTVLQKEIEGAMSDQLSGDAAKTWEAARKATAITKQTYSRGTAGGALTEPTARPSNVLANAIKGDTQSIKELKAATGGNPLLMEDVKRGVLDSIPRDANGSLTSNKMKSFLEANDGAVRELFGKDHYDNLKRVLQDLRSESKVAQNAFKSSKGLSVTQQRQTVGGAITDIMAESVLPGSGAIARVVDTIKRAANVKDTKAVEDLLFRAAMEPDFALELAKTPTETRILNVLQRIGNTIKESGIDAAQASGVQEMRTDATGQTPEWRRLGSESTARARSSGSEKQKTPYSKIKSGGGGSQPGLFSIGSGSSLFSGNKRSLFSKGAPMIDIAAVEQMIDSDPYMSALYEAESGRNPQAKNPKSSAKGGFQFIDATAKALGLEDPMDLAQSLRAAQKLTEDHRERFGNDPEMLYAAHYLGAPLLGKVLEGQPLSEKEQQIVASLKEMALPRFREIYSRRTNATVGA